MSHRFSTGPRRGRRGAPRRGGDPRTTARKRAGIVLGTASGPPDGRIAVVEEELVGDGTSATSGLILVERAPEDAQEFPVTGDGQ